MKTNFIIKNDIYPFDLMISIGESDKELEKRIWESCACDTEGVDKIINLKRTIRARTVMLSNNCTIIRFCHLPIKEGTIAHEVLHAVDFILYKVGISYSDDSSEAYNYLLDFFVQQIHDKIKKQPKKAAR